MQLWNDYEGRTIAETYPLGKLLRPEGRSAFFSTSNGTGTPSVIRIIEAHFDESEILTRWKLVSELAQPNLLAMRKYGEAVLDGTPLVYAVMEPAEANLSDVLQERTLTVEETRQLATSLIEALSALHSHNLIHEHIQPDNIHAVGETVKLRSDCIREAASGLEENDPEITARQARDVHDLTIVLLQSLTGHCELKGSATLLPTPFDAIIRNGLSGTWGLKQMAAALDSSRTPANSTAATQPRQPEQPSAQPLLPAASVPVPVTATPAQTTPAAPKPQPIASATASTRSNPNPRPNPAPQTNPPAASIAPDVRHRIVRPVVEDNPRRTRIWIASAVGVLLLLFLYWHFHRAQPETNAHPISTLATPTQDENATPAPKPTATHVTEPEPIAASPAAAHKQWRVIAYTYNREDQAQQKATSVATRDPALQPEVFSATGRAPYLVSLGGPMSRNEAAAFRKKALAAGLPHDTYIQNYAH